MDPAGRSATPLAGHRTPPFPKYCANTQTLTSPNGSRIRWRSCSPQAALLLISSKTLLYCIAPTTDLPCGVPNQRVRPGCAADDQLVAYSVIIDPARAFPPPVCSFSGYCPAVCIQLRSTVARQLPFSPGGYLFVLTWKHSWLSTATKSNGITYCDRPASGSRLDARYPAWRVNFFTTSAFVHERLFWKSPAFVRATWLRPYLAVLRHPALYIETWQMPVRQPFMCATSEAQNSKRIVYG